MPLPAPASPKAVHAHREDPRYIARLRSRVGAHPPSLAKKIPAHSPDPPFAAAISPQTRQCLPPLPPRTRSHAAQQSRVTRSPALPTSPKARPAPTVPFHPATTLPGTSSCLTLSQKIAPCTRSNPAPSADQTPILPCEYPLEPN